MTLKWCWCFLLVPMLLPLAPRSLVPCAFCNICYCTIVLFWYSSCVTNMPKYWRVIFIYFLKGYLVSLVCKRQGGGGEMSANGLSLKNRAAGNSRRYFTPNQICWLIVGSHVYITSWKYPVAKKTKTKNQTVLKWFQQQWAREWEVGPYL